MKNIFEIMKEYGLELPEEKQKDFEKAVLENYKTTADYEKQKDKLDKANDAITANDKAVEDLKKQLEGFKDVDVTALKNRIKDLETEKATQESDYQAKLSDRDFNDILKDSIASAHGKNVKAITALLEIDTLKASKNQKEEIAAALKTLSEAEDSKMLFGETKTDVAGNGNPIGTILTGDTPESGTAQMRAIMGLPAQPKTE